MSIASSQRGSLPPSTYCMQSLRQDIVSTRQLRRSQRSASLVQHSFSCFRHRADRGMLPQCLHDQMLALTRMTSRLGQRNKSSQVDQQSVLSMSSTGISLQYTAVALTWKVSVNVSIPGSQRPFWSSSMEGLPPFARVGT